MTSPFEIGIYTGLGVAAGVGLAYGGFSYASLWPSSRIFGEALIAPPKPGELALTFDDGPNNSWTPRLLELLANQGVHATFFLLGQRAQALPELVHRISEAGHVIGNHSWDHPNLARSSAARIRDELTRTQQTLEQIVGQQVRFFRPPYGARRPAVFRIAREMGLSPVLWNAMTSDWSDPSAERIAERLKTRIEKARQRGRAANIVLHDGGHRVPNANRGPSVTAAASLVEHYKQTCRFVTLDAWA